MVNQKVARKDLVDAVVKASTSDTWDEAVKEWEFLLLGRVKPIASVGRKYIEFMKLKIQ